MPLLSVLPDDVLLGVMEYLRVRDVLAVRKTSKNLYRVTRIKQIWLLLLKQTSSFGECLLPLHCRPLDLLSSRETESLVQHVLRLQCRMNAKSCAITAKLLPQPRPVTWLHIIQGQWLLVASSDSSTSVLQLWSLNTVLLHRDTDANSHPVAETFLGGPVCDGRAIVDDERTVIAIDIRSSNPWMELLTLTACGERFVFRRLAHLPDVSHIRCMDKTFVGFALYNETRIPCLLHWKSGTVLKLTQKRRLMGGCVAMAILGDLVATISPGKLELSAVNDSAPVRSRKLQEWDIFDNFSGACLMFYPVPEFPAKIGPQLSSTLRVYVSERNALHLFDLKVTSEDEELAAELCEVWKHQPDLHTDEYYPRFGVTPTTLTWFKGPGNQLKPVAFVIWQVTAPPCADRLIKTTSSPYEFVDANMPALYSFGVRDYDETRGILALGNAFGELAVYDFSRSDVEELAGCLNQIPSPATSTEELMPLVPIPVKTMPPYPYSRSYWPKVEERDSFINSWLPFQPDDLPDGWHTDFLPPNSHVEERHSLWAAYVPAIGSEAWWREYAQFYYGTQRPIMRFEDELTVFKAGGLLFINYDEYSFVYVMQDEDFSPDDIIRIFTGEMEVSSISRQRGDSTMVFVKKRFLKMRNWEWVMFGRNRWQELKDRGCEVDAYWLGEKPKLGEFTCIGPHCD